jgi:hypothetical protein
MIPRRASWTRVFHLEERRAESPRVGREADETVFTRRPEPSRPLWSSRLFMDGQLPRTARPNDARRAGSVVVILQPEHPWTEPCLQ